METIYEGKIKGIFNKISPISETSISRICTMLNYRVIPQGAYLTKRNLFNRKEYFIINGICRSHLLNPVAENITINFFKGPGVLTPHIIRTKNDISILNFQAVTEMLIAEIPARDFLNLMIENLEIRFFANSVLQNELIQKVEKEISLATLSAKERLLKFRETFTGLENEVPHTMIASYLGITNVTLSRIRKELSTH